jgi:hypothetical protein
MMHENDTSPPKSYSDLWNATSYVTITFLFTVTLSHRANSVSLATQNSPILQKLAQGECDGPEVPRVPLTPYKRDYGKNRNQNLSGQNNVTATMVVTFLT